MAARISGARVGGGPGRQRCASASRRESRTSTGTMRVASVAVSAERNERRRNSASTSSGSTATVYSAPHRISGDRAQPEHGAVDGRLERDVGLPEHRQVAEPHDHGQAVAA